MAPSGPILANITLSRGGNTAAFVGHSPEHPTEVFQMVDDAEPTRMTISNDWLPKLRFARQEAIRWTARDGLELEGVLVYPLKR